MLARVGELVADEFPPGGVGVAVLPAGPRVPRIVEDLRAAVEVGGQGEVVRLHELHHRLHLGLVLVFLRRVLPRLRERTVQIYAVTVRTDRYWRAVDLVVGGVVGAVRIVQRTDPNVDAVDQIGGVCI